MDVIWHKNDLRISDNPAVSHATEGYPVYVFDTRILEFASNRRLEWVIRNVEALREEYRRRGSDLDVRVGKATEVIPKVVDEIGADSVLCNESYSKLGRSRDRKVSEELDDVDFRTFHGEVMHEPNSIFTNKGEPYSVFTYYHKKWKKRDKEETYEPTQLHVFDSGRDIPTVEELGFDKPELELPEAGTDAARNRLRAFLKEKADSYDEGRDIPSDSNTSRLSPYLSYGVIGLREIWHETQSARDSTDEDSIDTFQEQLAWRDFYHQVLYHNPELVTRNYKDYENSIEWSEDEQNLNAWKEGRTGYPIVDAGMRQLKQEGWMHNRVRMIVASFLTKDLLIDWREGYKWFREMLIDHNTANDNGGWQWAASTGTDAQPYFRIFNPMTQGERFDEDAEYIKEYVPELQQVEASTIHKWNELSDEEREEICPDYTHPIVEHSEQREKALEMFKKARGEEE